MYVARNRPSKRCRIASTAFRVARCAFFGPKWRSVTVCRTESRRRRNGFGAGGFVGGPGGGFGGFRGGGSGLAGAVVGTADVAPTEGAPGERAAVGSSPEQDASSTATAISARAAGRRGAGGRVGPAKTAPPYRPGPRLFKEGEHPPRRPGSWRPCSRGPPGPTARGRPVRPGPARPPA